MGLGGLVSKCFGGAKGDSALGLSLVNANANETKEGLIVDVVAVHGLGGHAKMTWTDSKTDYFWLQDIAERKYAGKTARVFTYGYDATVAFGRSITTISGHANALLDKISGHRTDKDLEVRRPIIFICHSLGGIVVKNALLNAHSNPVYKNLFESVYGIIFLGTPHQGSEAAAVGNTLLKAISITSRLKSSGMLKHLKTNSEELENISNNFRHFVSGNGRKVERIVSIVEQLTTPGYGRVIVNYNSAVLGLGGDLESIVLLNTDHIGLSKFQSREDDNYRTVFRHVEQLIEGAGTRHEATMLVDHEILSKRLHKVNYQAQYEEALGRRCDKTVQWLLRDSVYVGWKNSRLIQAIWLNGEVGSGKTVAAASLIEDLQGERRAIVGPGYRPLVLYFFCDGKEAAKAETSNVVEVLLHQILIQCPSVGYEMSRSIRKLSGQFSLTLSNGIRILQEALSSVPKAFLVIDALDECTGGKSELLDALLKTTRNFGHLRLLVTTRSHPGSELYPVFQKRSNLVRQISLAEEHVRSDIDIFLKSQIDQSSDIEFLDIKLKETVKTTIREQARGIFLWASLAWEMFLSSGEAWSEAGVRSRLEMLHELGKGGSNFQHNQSIPDKQQRVSLYGLYEAILERVPDHDKSRARRLFLLMVVAQTPLTLEELKIASALEPTHTSLDSVKGNLHAGNFENAVRSMCCPLVKIARGNTVMLVHQSVKEYFLEGNHRHHSYALESEEAHLLYSITCLTFLGFTDFANTAPYTTASETSEIDLHNLAARPFLRYSALHWSTHVAQVQFRPEVWERFLRLTQSGTALVYAFRLFWYTGGKGPFPLESTPMDILCYMGLDLLVEKAFSVKGPDESDLVWATANAPDSIGRTALHWGAGNGHTNIVRILLENGGSPDVEARLEDNSTFTPLAIAAEYGHVEVMKLLMSDTSGDIERGRLLELAAVGGHTEVMEALTAYGVDVNVAVGDRSALHSAAFQDHIESVGWLLQNGANVNLNDPRHGTPLQVAAYEGNLEMVKLLLDSGADPNLGNGVYGSPLHAAAFRDWKDIASVLIERGADVNAEVGHYGTVVNAARTNGHTTMVSFLRSFGAPIRVFSTPLRRASILDEPSMYGVTLVEHEIKKGRMPGLEKRKKKFIQGLLSAVEDENKRRLDVMLQIGLKLFKMAVRADRDGFQLLIVRIATMILLEAVKRNFHNGITTMTSLYTSALTFVLDEGKPLLVERLLSECVKDFNVLIDDGKDDEAKIFEVAAIEVILTVVGAGNEQLIEIVADKWMEAFEGVIGGRFGRNLLSVIEDYGLKWVSAVEQQANDRVMIWGRTAAEVLSAAAFGKNKQVSRALSTLFSQMLQSVFDKSKDSARRLSEECQTRVSQIPVSEISAQRLVRVWILGLEFFLATERGGRHGRDCKESQEVILKLSRSFLQAVEDSDRLVAVIQITRDFFSEKIQDCKDDVNLSLLKKDISSVIDAVIGVHHGTELEKMLNLLKDDIKASR